MIHLGDTCEYGATPLEGCIVITEENLKVFKKNVKDFSLAIKTKLNQFHHKLRAMDIKYYSREIKA